MTLMGLGHDVVDVKAFTEQLAEPGTRMRSLFSARELRQSAQRARVKHDGESVHLAARWAGKEAVLKAWCEAIAQLPQHADAGDGGGKAGEYPYTIDDFPWREVEILDDSRGCPRAVLSARLAAAVADSLGMSLGMAKPGIERDHAPIFHVSLSHDGPIASAVAMLQVES